MTDKLLAKAIERGAELIIGEVTGISIEDNKVKGITMRNKPEAILADKVVVAMGPWSGPLVEDWFDVPFPMQGIKSTSLVFEDCAAVTSEPYACFCEDDRHGCHLEIYPRPNGEVYVCGIGGSDYVAGDRLRPGGNCDAPEKILADPARVMAGSHSLSTWSSVFSSKRPAIEQVRAGDEMESCVFVLLLGYVAIMRCFVGVHATLHTGRPTCDGACTWCPRSLCVCWVGYTPSWHLFPH